MAVIDELYILWTDNDPLTFKKMVSMYAINSLQHDWWDQVTVIIWGASAELVANDQEIRQQLVEMQQAGVRISACRACAEELGVSEILEEIGVEVIYWGEPLTEVIKSEQRLICI